MSNSNTEFSHLLGQCVVITRPSAQASPLTELLRRYGALPLEYPVLVLRPVQNEEREHISAYGRELAAGKYDAAVFASVNAVNYFFDIVEATSLPKNQHFFAVGQKTAEALLTHGFKAAFPECADSEHLLQYIFSHYKNASGCQDRRFLMPRARGGRVYLLEQLRHGGAAVDAPPLYDTEALDNGPPLPSHFELHWITFTSPSAVRAFMMRSPIAPRIKVACIGPTTAKAATDAGLEVNVTAREQSIEGLVRAMAEEHKKNRQVFS